jgi:hypothetical protein
MQNISMPTIQPPLRLRLPEYRPGASNAVAEPVRQRQADHQFVAMLNAYRGHGGLARVQEVMERFRRSRGPDIARLANWIARRQVICFEWQSQSWLPLFQFNRADMAPQAELAQLFAELVAIYDNWELANWFVLPHPRLADRAPVALLAADRAAVWQAAHADRLACSA